MLDETDPGSILDGDTLIHIDMMHFYILRNAYLGCIKDDECPGNKPDCRSGVCIKGLFHPMSKEGGEGSLPSVGCLFT